MSNENLMSKDVWGGGFGRVLTHPEVFVLLFIFTIACFIFLTLRKRNFCHSFALFWHSKQRKRSASGKAHQETFVSPFIVRGPYRGPASRQLKTLARKVKKKERLEEWMNVIFISTITKWGMGIIGIKSSQFPHNEKLFLHLILGVGGMQPLLD